MSNSNKAGFANSFSSLFAGFKTSALQNLKKKVILAFGVVFVIFTALQVTFLTPDAIAAPFGKQIEKMTEDGKTDKVIDNVSNTAKDISKESGNRAKSVAKDVEKGTKENLDKAENAVENLKEGTKQNIGRAQNATKNVKNDIKGSVDDAKNRAGDRTGEALDKTKELSNKADNGVNGIINSVKEFFGK